MSLGVTQLVGFGVGAAEAALTGLVFVGGKATSYAENASQAISLTDLIGGIDTAPSAGDIVIVAVGFRGTDANITVTDYTEVADLYANDTVDANLGVFYKRLTAADTSVTIGSTTASDGTALVAIHVWRNTDASTPIDVATTTDTGIDSGTPDPPSITPVTTGAVILGIGVSSGSASTTTATMTHPALGNLVGTAVAGSAKISMGSISWPGGAYNPASFDQVDADNEVRSWAAVTMALRPV